MQWWRRMWQEWLEVTSRIWPVAGVILLVVAAGFWVKEWRGTRGAERALATVTELEPRQDAQGVVNYFPHVRFRLGGGELVQVVSKVGENPPGFAAGETVPVQYRAADGRDAEIATTGRVYRMAVVLGALGTALFDLGAVFWAFRRYRETYGRTQRAQPRRGGWGRRG